LDVRDDENVATEVANSTGVMNSPGTNGPTNTNRFRISETQGTEFATNCTKVSETQRSNVTLTGDITHDAIDVTPPPKRSKFFFQRCFDATFNPSKVYGAQKVLAPDSDDEDIN
jgi:hypothetical protein